VGINLKKSDGTVISSV